ncbi:Fe2Og dioxygenase [Bandra megavirus]|uniref:Fe2Og dioxygenase n=1 Tax=Bandra megavirus TaxID=2071566 RepID=A0A2K9V8D3_9VIRU|nr:Fe2Og dioxygenase [Bandra megavirus]
MSHKPYKYIPFDANNYLYQVIDFNNLYQQLVEEIDLKREYIPVTYSNEKIPERRETAWQSSTDIVAEYSGKKMIPKPFSPTVLKIKQLVEKIIGIEFNSALFFHYVNDGDKMGYHFDTKGVHTSNHIASITIGGDGTLMIRDNVTHEKECFKLSNGDIFYMFDDCQEKYKHAVLPIDFKNPTSKPRLAITFRIM